LQQQQAPKNIETTILNIELQTNQIQKQITDLELQKIEQLQKLELTSANARSKLLGQINKWKETNLITAPGKGTISYLGFLENDLFVEPC